MKLKIRMNCIVLMFVLAVSIGTAEAYTFSQGHVGSQFRGRELDGAFVDVQNPDGAVDYKYPPPVIDNYTFFTTGYSPTSVIRGYADPGVQQLNTFSSGVYAFAANNQTASADSFFGNRFTVDAGTSGKNVGDATTITLNFGFDGHTDVGGDRYDGYSSWVNVSSGFRLWDPTIMRSTPEEEDYGIRYLIDFNARSYDHKDAYSGGYMYNENGWSWDVDAWHDSTSSYEILSDSYSDWSELAPNQKTTCSGPGGCTVNSFDMGTLSFSIDTYVGAELYYYSKTGILSQAHGSTAHAHGDFLDTFGGSITADDPGVNLSFELQPTVVPEPISSTLFLVGGATLGFRRFRKKFKK